MDDGVSCCQRKMQRNGQVRFTLTSSRVIPSSLASSICPLFAYINLGGEKIRLLNLNNMLFLLSPPDSSDVRPGHKLETNWPVVVVLLST
jgi:hypothetical protein